MIVCSGSALASEYLGILSELTNPQSDVAQKLQITEEQLTELKKLTNRRTSAAVSLAAQLKEAPKSQHSELLSAFAAESEKMAADVLDDQQRGQLKKLKMQWQGLVSLAEDELATTLNLDESQRSIVAQWREQLRDARRVNRLEQVKPQAERAIRSELSDSQWVAWQWHAGLSNQAPSESPLPPQRELESTPSNAASDNSTAIVSTVPAAPVDAALLPIEQVDLELNFQRQPWGDVIRWLAEQADLSVHSEVTPPGTFTYRDRSRKYSVSETLDVMNAYLLDSGYSLFRQGRMLRCVNFEQDQAMRGELLKELTDTITEGELATRGRYEPVRVLFTLKRLDPDQVVEEVKSLLSVQGTAVSLISSGQLLVTDMAGNVRNVAEFIRRAEDPTSARGTAVQTMQLKSITAEEILAVARPLLDLDSGSNVSDSIRISTNTFGTTLYARGDADKVELLRELAQQMDRPPADSDKPIQYETPYVGRHLVRGIDLQLAYQVASQLLAGSPDVKLATDETAKQLVLMGRKADHQLIKETLDSLAGEVSDFKVISLQNLDTQMAIAAVKKFFGLSDKAEPSSGQPVIDGDSVARQLWVKGSATQVQQIEDLISKLEGTAKSTKNLWGDHLRMVPMSGSGSADALRQAAMIWQQMSGNRNPLVSDAQSNGDTGLKARSFAPQQKNVPQATTTPSPPGRSTSKPSSTAPASNQPAADSEAAAKSIPGGVLVMAQDAEGSQRSEYSQPFDEQSASDVSEQTAAEDLSNEPDLRSSGAPIVVQEGPGGLIVSSEDAEALERFDNLLRMMMEQNNLSGMDPEVVYLQNIKAAAAKQLLTEILSGAAASASAEGGGGSGGGLLGNMASGLLGGVGGGMLGSLLGGGSGGGGSSALTPGNVGMASSSYSIVADPRLNALFIKAHPADMRLIEQLLRVIDQVESPFSVETQGVTSLIPVLTQDVAAVLETVKSVFGERIAGVASSANRTGGGGGGGGGSGNPLEFLSAMRSAFGGGGAQRRPAEPAKVELSEPKISIGADTHTNTLVVIGQPYQIEEVRKLVSMLDEAGESEKEEVAVVEMGPLSSDALTNSLQRVLGSRAQTTVSGGPSGSSSSASRPSGSTSGSAGQFDPDAARRRAEFFMQMLRGGGGGGNLGSGRTGAGGGGTNRGTNRGTSSGTGGNRRGGN
ncbi:MAG: hypothetical protein KF752_03395 [Pirellulaceae bacterium]|nr:hypothetical protein [Pirellulaceae bacterium]